MSNRYNSFFDQYAIAAQRTLAVPTAYPPPSDFGRAQLFVLPTRRELSLSVEGVGNTAASPDRLEMLNIDTLCGKVDRTTSSWTIDVNISRITIKLRFPDCQALDAFLFALSYVRLSDFIETRSQSTTPLTERGLTQRDLQRFRDRRALAYRRSPIAVLPVEVLSEIFSLLPSCGHRRSAFASTLLPLWVCSEWRSVAVGTATLWRAPPRFTLVPSFFRRGGGAQAVLWLNRAKGCDVTLSIKCPLNSRGIFDLLRSQPAPFIQPSESPFTAVQSLDLICLPSHLNGGSIWSAEPAVFPSLKLLRLDITFCPHTGRRPAPSYLLNLFRSAPLLRDASIVADPWDRYRRHSFAALLPWAQLTALSMQVILQVSAWVHILVQCTSLETGQFALYNEEASPPFPLGILTLAYLVSLRLVFHHVRDTRFFDHLSLPRLGNLHVEGTLVNTANISFVANYPALRDLTVHLNLFDHGLQHLIQRSTALPEFQSPSVQRLRSFTVVASTLFTAQTLAENFIKTSPNWIVRMVLLDDCDFKLFGESPLLESFRMALGTAAPLEASIGRTSLERWGREPVDSDFLRLRKVRAE
ncbi:hypothetical protein C8R46DRAFT_1029338 [Mycena filopes]|nr:hypothetical protein C8R46DRAFT_1029338 [Mycena filopes]